ncbi:hypothetical protein IB270_30475 [Ensifer sp. ENS05]|uniref:hypothetical protein n=1 Tax=Ensifer sp. ENS05 TaxID=2769277 RepID=UPI00178649FE|nr:hypothetical protein [Ensifer sp. ENS05]MBD9597163.1 hypothetical protein [Ensifer sp. ENS05]
MNNRERMKVLIMELLAMPKDKSIEEAIVSEINMISPDPQWSNYIFQTDDYVMDDDMVFSYKPIIL